MHSTALVQRGLQLEAESVCALRHASTPNIRTDASQHPVCDADVLEGASETDQLCEHCGTC